MSDFLNKFLSSKISLLIFLLVGMALGLAVRDSFMGWAYQASAKQNQIDHKALEQRIDKQDSRIEQLEKKVK